MFLFEVDLKAVFRGYFDRVGIYARAGGDFPGNALYKRPVGRICTSHRVDAGRIWPFCRVDAGRICTSHRVDAGRMSPSTVAKHF